MSSFLQVSKGSDQKQPRKSDTIVPIISLGDVVDAQRQANSAVRGRLWPKFELIEAFRHRNLQE